MYLGNFLLAPGGVKHRLRGADMADWRANLGARIRDLRTERGLTQGQLAEAAGLDQGNVARIEQGAKGLSIPALLRLAAALGVPAGRLLDAEPPGSPAARADVAALLETCDEGQVQVVRDLLLALKRFWPTAP